MNKRVWFLPVLIVVVNTIAVIVRWKALPEIIPAHFDLQGNAGGSMPRNMLLLQPLLGTAVCMTAYIIARLKQRLQTGFVILASGICLILMSSTMVSLTSGQMPIFMLSEPVILLLSLTAFIICMVRSCKSKS